jgi:hypothetical protein
MLEAAQEEMRMMLERLSRPEPQVRQPVEQRVERDPPLVTDKRRPNAEMNAEAAEKSSTPSLTCNARRRPRA